MRLGVPLLVLILASPLFVAALDGPTSVQASGDGCTPCGCNVAYCEGNVTFHRRLDWAHPVDLQAPLGQAQGFAWRLALVDAGNATPSGPVSWGESSLVVSRSPIDRVDGPSGDATLVGAEDATFPSVRHANVTFDGEGAWYVAPVHSSYHGGGTYAGAFGEPVAVVVVAAQDEKAGPGSSRGLAGVASWALLALLALAAAGRRRFS